MNVVYANVKTKANVSLEKDDLLIKISARHNFIQTAIIQFIAANIKDGEFKDYLEDVLTYTDPPKKLGDEP